MRKKRILIFVQDGVGGAERVQIEIAKMLLADGWQVKLCKVGKSGQPAAKSIDVFYPESVEAGEIRFHSQLSLIKGLYREIEAFRPAVAFASVMNINRPLLCLAPFFRKTRFVVRNNNYLYTIPRVKRWAVACTYRWADAIIAQTEEMAQELHRIGLSARKIATLHNPLNREEILRKSSAGNPYADEPEAVHFVAVGRFAYQKGFDTLIRAFRLVCDELPTARLHLIGNTAYGNEAVFRELSAFIRQHGLEDKVFFPGILENPYPHMRHADAFVLSSRWEGLPNTLIEAQLLGTPAAATRCIPIIARIVDEGKNGYLCPPDDAQALAAAMLQARTLGRITMSYRPSEASDFIELFNRQTI